MSDGDAVRCACSGSTRRCTPHAPTRPSERALGMPRFAGAVRHPYRPRKALVPLCDERVERLYIGGMKHPKPHPSSPTTDTVGPSNPGIPGGIDFNGTRYLSAMELYQAALPGGKVKVPLNTFLSRVKRLAGRGDLTQATIEDALHMIPAAYKAKYATRKTIITVDGKKLDLHVRYLASTTPPAVSFATARQRLRSRHLAGSVTNQVLDDALTLPGPAWITFYGGGRHRGFVYTGELHPEHQGKPFHSITALLMTIGRYADRALIWNRIKGGWDLDNALAIPVDLTGDRLGLIYKITRIKTGQVYVGLTISSVEQRWAFHLSAASRGSQTRLAQAIREDGREGFSIVVVEQNIADPGTLKAREIHWVAELGALGAIGLNTAPPGNLGRRTGIRTQDGDDVFQSDAERFRVLGKRHGVPAHVAEARIRSGTPAPWTARKHSKDPEAGTGHYRRWLALLRRHPGGVDDRWASSYKNFMIDTMPIPPGHHLVRPDASQPWGRENFTWMTPRQKIEAQRGTKVVAFGIEHPSLEALAVKFNIGVSTLKDRVRRQGLAVEAALEIPVGRTPGKSKSKIDDLV